jgi:fission process protein 1
MPWWGKSEKPQPDEAQESKGQSNDTDFDPNKLPARQRLPKGLQQIVEKSDKDSRFFDDVVDG